MKFDDGAVLVQNSEWETGSESPPFCLGGSEYREWCGFSRALAGMKEEFSGKSTSAR